MIQSFQCNDTQALFAGKRVARFANFEAVALRKLQQIHAATVIEFLRVPPGNQLEALKGDRKGQHSIRINAQWRVWGQLTKRKKSYVKTFRAPLMPEWLIAAILNSKSSSK